jgi:hypothetical protein
VAGQLVLWCNQHTIDGVPDFDDVVNAAGPNPGLRDTLQKLGLGEGQIEAKVQRETSVAIVDHIDNGQSIERFIDGIMLAKEAIASQCTPQVSEVPRAKATSKKQSAKTLRPKWDRDTGKLTYDNVTIKQIKHIGLATNVIAILDEFESRRWPTRIVDPLGGGKNPQRLGEAIRSSNDGLAIIKFSGDGTGSGIRWERLEDLLP